MSRSSNRSRWTLASLAWFSGLALGPVISVAAPLTRAELEQLPPPVSRTVDFSKEVRSILEVACAQCHARGKAQGGFSFEDRAALLRGGDSGPAVIPGRSAESLLIRLVAGLDPDNVMPQKGSRLSPDNVGILRAWIDQGVAWEAGLRLAKTEPLHLGLRRPELPRADTGGDHPIDRLLRPYFEAQKLVPPAAVSDRVFARRAHLDVMGLLPSPKALQEFVEDPSAGKRERLVRALLADRRGYAEHWLSFWNDALRNDYAGPGYIDGGRRQITAWLLAALIDNLPFDQFVRELVAPASEAEGFTRGILWRGAVNASQTPEMQAAQNIAQVFMGVNLKCASCHDSFVDDWTLADAYGLAAVYAEKPLEIVHCDRPTGKFAELKFLYAQLGQVDSSAPRPERLRQLAALMTSEANGQLSRTIVNRLWASFLGRGLIEPVDDMQGKPWHRDLLDWLAADLVDHGYDLKRTMEVILTSQAYQMPSVPAEEGRSTSFSFRGPLVRRMTAEQFLDAIACATGEWRTQPAAQAELPEAALTTLDPRSSVRPRWIWDEAGAADRALPGKRWFRRTFEVPGLIRVAAIVITADNRFRLWVNGKEVASGSDFRQPQVVDVRGALVPGRNVLAVEAANDAAAGTDPANPAGLLAQLRLRTSGTDVHAPGSERVGDWVTDDSWRSSDAPGEGWQYPSFDDSVWKPAVEVGEAAAAPWRLEQRFATALASTAFIGRTRAALLLNDPLAAALGRPNREQVVTRRLSAATTLQLLELTNGQTLAAWLRRGAERLLATVPQPGPHLVDIIHERALGREPSATERSLAEELLGFPAHREGVEDLLWAVTMLPEFQLIY